MGSRARWLVLYGVVAAVFGCLALALLAPPELPMLGTRQDGVLAAQRQLEAGHPPLLAQNEEGKYLPVGTTDDQGIYLYGSLLGWISGEDTPGLTLKWIWLFLFGITLAIYPLVFNRLFGSMAVALAAPVVGVVLIVSFGWSDLYWITPWATITLLPVVFALWERWPRRYGLAVLALVCVAASFASSIRGQAGLPVALAALALVVTRPWPGRRRVLAGALVVIAYLSVTVGAFSAVREYRDSWVDDPSFGAGEPTSHPLWHNAYIGLGYLPNEWNLRWLDEVGIATIKQSKPDARYLSREYLDEARRLYLELATKHPGFFAEAIGSKALVSVAHYARFLAVAALLLPLLLIKGPRRREMRRWTLLTLPALVLGFLQPLVAMPNRPYELGVYGALGLLLVLAGSTLLDPVLGAARRAAGRGAGGARALIGESLGFVRSLARDRGGRLVLVLSAIGVLVAVSASLAARPVEDRAIAWLEVPNPPAPRVP
jgi:hypothetical protein